ncbi:hypothetical protein G5S89_08065, partial [Lactobacillus jensenii]|nr:hypothetical protein [Lactobacillus jensenii]
QIGLDFIILHNNYFLFSHFNPKIFTFGKLVYSTLSAFWSLATRSTFNGSEEFEFFLSVNGEAEFKGHDIVLNPNGATQAVQDNATFRSNVLA